MPNVAFVVESPHIFGNFLRTLDETEPIEDSIWKVTQSGVKKDKKFVFERVPGVEPLDLSEIEEEVESLGDIDEFLDGLADPERLEQFTADKPDDWVYNEYGGPKKSEKKSESKGSSRSRRRAKAEEEPEGEEETPEEEPKEERGRSGRGRSRASRAASGGSRRRGGRDFSNLRKKADA